jgi:hypothetical protein
VTFGLHFYSLLSHHGMTEPINVFEKYRDTAQRNQSQMIILAKEYNNQVDQSKKIPVKGCSFCTFIKRKIYHRIIFEWYDAKGN